MQQPQGNGRESRLLPIGTAVPGPIVLHNPAGVAKHFLYFTLDNPAPEMAGREDEGTQRAQQKQATTNQPAGAIIMTAAANHRVEQDSTGLRGQIYVVT